MIMAQITILNQNGFGKSNVKFVKLKITYDIDLLNIFPPVLETIICEYINDIVKARINKWRPADYHVTITDEYISCNDIHCTINYEMHKYKANSFCVTHLSNNIAHITSKSERWYPFMYLASYYMKQYYNDKYIDITNFRKSEYENIMMYAKHNLDTITYFDDYYDETTNEKMSITVIDHQLFKNILDIVKVLYDMLSKN